MTEEEKKENNKEDVAIALQDAKTALAVAKSMLSAFDEVFYDEEQRKRITVGSGIVLGGGLGDILEAMKAEDDTERNERLWRGGQTLLEVLIGTALGIDARKKEKWTGKKK